MASDHPIWPVTVKTIPLGMTLKVNAYVNKFGGLSEQRIVNDLPYQRASDGTGRYNQTFVGQFNFSVRYEQVFWSRSARSENALLQDDLITAWRFFLDLHYDTSGSNVQWLPFYWYNKGENDDLSTWTGSDASSGTNSRGEGVDQYSGRYLVRFVNSVMSIEQFKSCLFRFGLELVEVDA